MAATVSSLKLKVKELEAQVADYKKKLDELRKAKSTVITKREREILEVRDPNLGRRTSQNHDPKVAELENQLEDLNIKYKAELTKAGNASPQATSVIPCDHEGQIAELKLYVAHLEAENYALSVGNKEYKDNAEKLMTQLTIKETEWCENEELLKSKLKSSFNEQYKEWMAETEKKIEELQRANAFLSEIVHRQRVTGRNPTGQDKS